MFPIFCPSGYTEEQRAEHVRVSETFAALHAGSDEVAGLSDRDAHQTGSTRLRHGK